MKRTNKGNYILDVFELYALLSAFDKFHDILVKVDGKSRYFSIDDLTCLDEDNYKQCLKLYNDFFKEQKGKKNVS